MRLKHVLRHRFHGEDNYREFLMVILDRIENQLRGTGDHTARSALSLLGYMTPARTYQAKSKEGSDDR